MAPKKSKKEKQAEKEAELARIAEEQRLEEERLAKEKEEEEKRLAAELKARQEAEQAMQGSFEALIDAEDAANEGTYKELNVTLVNERQKAFDQEDWAVFIACEPLPDVQREAEVNTFLTEWSEKPRFGADHIEKTLDECTLCAELLRSLQLESAYAAARKAAKQAAWQHEIQLGLKEEMDRKIDGATADFLQRAEEFWDKETQTCQKCVEAAGCRFGLWVNLAKNPRTKSLTYDELNIKVELPKVLALASIALRAVQYATDLCSPYAKKEAAAVSPYMTLGGILEMSLLNLPAGAKKVKGWTMREVNELTDSVKRMQYPMPAADGSLPLPGTAPMLRIHLNVDPSIILPPTVDTVGYWNDKEGKWEMEEIADVQFDADTRTLSFDTTRLSSLALLQKTTLELPYKKWLFSPSGASSGTFYLQTQRFELQIDVTPSGCTLRGPVLPELASLIGVSMAASKLVLRLKACGINLSPKDNDATAKELRRITPKEAEIESALHENLKPLLSKYQLAPSRWNQSRGAGKCTVRFALSEPTFDADDEVAAAPADPYAAVGDWACLEYSKKRSVLIAALDSDATCDETPAKDGAHSTPLECLKAENPDVLDVLHASSRLYQDTVRQLFDELRPLSFTAAM